MKKEITLLIIGFMIGSAITFGCARLFVKPGKMFWAKEDLTVALDSTAHIFNRQAEKSFSTEIVIPKGTCLNDGGVRCGGDRHLNLILAFSEAEVVNYFSEGIIEGNTPITRVVMLYRNKTQN